MTARPAFLSAGQSAVCRTGLSLRAVTARSYGDVMDETAEVELHGGPPDGQRVPVLLEHDDPWIAVISDHGTYPGGRSLYWR